MPKNKKLVKEKADGGKRDESSKGEKTPRAKHAQQDLPGWRKARERSEGAKAAKQTTKDALAVGSSDAKTSFREKQARAKKPQAVEGVVKARKAPEVLRRPAMFDFSNSKRHSGSFRKDALQ